MFGIFKNCLDFNVEKFTNTKAEQKHDILGYHMQ